MGYNTRYRLTTVYHEAASPVEVVEAFVKSSDDASYCLSPNGDSNERGTWYGHEAELIALSRRHPHLLFVLNGWGEEAGDVWVKYFHNGRMQTEKASLQLGGFDPAKLK